MCGKIAKIIEKAVEELAALHEKESTIRTYKEKCFDIVSRIYSESGVVEYDEELMESISHRFTNQYERGDITRNTYNIKMRGISMLKEIYNTGTYTWKKTRCVSNVDMSDPFKELYIEFIDYASINWGNTCVRRYSYIITQFLLLLETSGISDIQHIPAQVIEKFLKERKEKNIKSMDSVIAGLRKLSIFLRDKGYNVEGFWELLAAPRARDRTIKPIIDEKVLSKIITSIDTSKSPGKRNLAIIVLAIHTGMRACDISYLKREDVKWRKNEIHYISPKTGRPCILPVPQIVMNALADYILNERPNLDSDFIFLSQLAPHNRLESGGIRAFFNRILKNIGVEREKNDGLTFHGIRRTLGTNMVKNCVSVETVQQVLGHQDLKPTKQYISLDVTNLFKCTLSINDIEC